MAASEGFIELLKDVLSGLGPVSVRRMFGGAGVYADGVMFGLIADDTLYLKADDETKGTFEAEGLGPYGYGGPRARGSICPIGASLSASSMIPRRLWRGRAPPSASPGGGLRPRRAEKRGAEKKLAKTVAHADCCQRNDR